MIGECLLCFPPPRLSLVLTFIAAAIILAATVTLTNFAQAEVTGKAVPPTGGVCANIPGLGAPLGIGEWSATPPRPFVVCAETLAEFTSVGGLVAGQSFTLTTATHHYVVEARRVGGTDSAHVARVIDLNPPPSPQPAPDSPNNGNNISVTVQAKSSNDAKRLAQYGAAGFAAVVLIHNYWFAAPGAALPFHLAFNEKGAIYSGTSFRLSPRETLHLSALESLDDKRGEYKFGVQWHYQFAPPRGTTKTPPAAPPPSTQCRMSNQRIG